QSLSKLRIISRLEPEHARDQLQAILHPMIDLLHEHLLVLKRCVQSSLLALPLNRHAEDIGRALQERDIVLAELALGSAIDFKHPVGGTITLQDDVHSSANAMGCKQLGRSEAILALQVVRDHRFARAQGKTRRRGKVRPDGGCTNQALIPAYPSTHQESILRR